MGGCRCSYKNCNVKTDGKTHMFHYPVFDRLRCHQWLLNAHKLDFLNLKVSQLKNRVVCQHHFKDDNFMNFKKDKLTFDAVPTENGPYCDPSQLAETNDENIQSFPLTMEDIENESLLYCDKRANYSVKYGDFLTNSEINFMNSLNTENIDVNVNTICNQENENEICKAKKDMPIITDLEHNSNKLVKPSKLILPLKPSIASSGKKVARGSASDSLKLREETKFEVNDISLKNEEPQMYPEVAISNIQLVSENKTKKKEPKIKIISEKKIKDPITLPKNLQTISPSEVLKIPMKNKPQQFYSLDLSNQPSLNIGESGNTIKPIDDKYVVTVQFESQEQQETPQKTVQLPNQIEIALGNNTTPLKPKKPISKSLLRTEPSKMALLKNKISPQRIAAIEEKRKFNMKLRDMIETCLVDKQTVIKKEEPQIINTVIDAKEKNSNDIEKKSLQMPSYLSKTSELPNAQDITTYLDTRLKRLENTLLNRIDQNTQRIMELKNSVAQAPTKMASTSVQTLGNEECYKKYLFQEISKFLSPSSNSLVYEELFINKYSLEKDNNNTTAKRRRCR